MQRCLGAMGLALVAACSLACSTPVPAPAPRSGTYSEYRVGAPDDLMITVLPDPQLQRPARVRPDGMISFDLIGDVPASGRTIDEISADIEKRISRFKRDPSVTVQLVQTLSTGISVLGEFGRRSTFPLVKETRVSEAIAQVGGPTTFARTKKIRVIRSGGGETAVYYVNLDAIQAGDLTTDIVLASGDIIYAEPNIFAKIGYAVQAMLFPFEPVLGLGRTVAGVAIGN